MPANRPDATPNADAAPSEQITTDICVIGAGSGGLSVAAAAAAFGQSVVLIEKHKMGGDCLNYGCVPSKALIAAGKRAHAMRTASKFGIADVNPEIDPAAVNDHVRSVIAAIEPNDSVERFTGLGVRVILAAGRFVDKSTVVAGEYRIKARRFVVATGSSPFVPPIPGLNSVPYFSNETIFDYRDRLHHLIVIGGGPIGMEMSQAHRRLGSRVTVLEGSKALGRDDPELSKIVLEELTAEGIDLRQGSKVERVEGGLGRVLVHVASGDQKYVVEGTHLLVAVGRKVNVSELGLEAAGIRYDKRGIKVNIGLRTSNRRVYAIGDVAGQHQFTHVANYHAGIVVRRVLFRLPAKVNPNIIPWTTYTEPELANVGLSEEAARKATGGKINVLRCPIRELCDLQARKTRRWHRRSAPSTKQIYPKFLRASGADRSGHRSSSVDRREAPDGEAPFALKPPP